MDKYLSITTDDIYSMLEENTTDRLKSDAIMKSRNDNRNVHSSSWSRFAFYQEIIADNHIDGFIMQYPHGRVIRQAQRSYFYRGENQIFDFSRSSLYRKLSAVKNDDQVLVEEFVAHMRIADFRKLLLRFAHTQDFMEMPLSVDNQSIRPGIDLLYEQIAQHYGFDTPWLDITSDFEIALFFACCRFDDSLKKWEPLNEQDFNMKPETKFGVIFRQNSSHPNNYLPSHLQTTSILPVGFQPFMRCHMQSGYVALMDRAHYLQKENSFEKLRFKHNEELANSIYEKMDGGKKIYPHEGLSSLETEIEEIRKRKVFTRETFDFTLGAEKFTSIGHEDLGQLLVAYDYEIVDACNYISKEKIEQVNRLYHGFDIEKNYNITLSTRSTFSPSEE